MALIDDLLGPQEPISPLRPDSMPSEEELIEEERRKKEIELSNSLKERFGAPIDKTGTSAFGINPSVEETEPNSSAIGAEKGEPSIEEGLEDFQKVDLPGYPEKDLYPKYEVPSSVPSTNINLNLGQGDKFRLSDDESMKIIDTFFPKIGMKMPSFDDPPELQEPKPDLLRMMAASARDLGDIFGNRPYRSWIGDYLDKEDVKKTKFQEKRADLINKTREENRNKLKGYADLYKTMTDGQKERFSAFKELRNIGLTAFNNFEDNRIKYDDQQLKRFGENRQGIFDLIKASGQFTDDQIAAFSALSDNSDKNQKNKIALFKELNDSKKAAGKGDFEHFDRITKVIDQLEGSPEWKDHEVIGQSFQRFVRAPRDGSGDLTRIYDFIKTLSPDAVREGEIKNIDDLKRWINTGPGSNALNRFEPLISQQIQKFAGGGPLQEEVRQSMLSTMVSSYTGRRSALQNIYNSKVNMLNKWGLNEGSVQMPIDYMENWLPIDNYQRALAKQIKKWREIKQKASK